VDLALRAPGALDAEVTGSAIVYGRGAETARDVVATYLPGLKQVDVPRGALGDLDVAVVVTDGYEPVEPGEGDGPTPAPDAEC
jgi:hypothetical protein